jgi:V8-like Glu-specific endopeptidase
MNIDNPGTQLLFTTVPLFIENNDASRSSATGFIYTANSKQEGASIPFLVTNYHVIKNAKRILIEVIEANNEKPNKESKLRVEVSGDEFRHFIDKNNDLALLPIAPILNQFSNTGKQVFYRTIDSNMVPDEKKVNQLGAIEDVTFIGYPSGIYDAYNSTPLVRRGITASPIWNDFKGESCFLIDAGVYPGSSGSPVFIYNQGSYGSDLGLAIGTRLLFIGVITDTMIGKSSNQNNFFLGLGKVVKSTLLRKFVNDVVAKVDN